jgi:predicted RNase H-like HicB family nuclease
MKFMATLDRDENDTWVSERLSIPGCLRQGQTREEAISEG